MRKGWLVFVLVAVLSFVAVASDTLDVYFINVGAGDAILIDCGNWEALLDVGRGYSAPNAAVLAVLAEHVDDGIIELAILSHPHADHYGGFEEVLKHYEVWEFWRSIDADPDTDGATYSRFRNALAAEGLVPRLLERGDQHVTGQIELVVLGPGELKSGSPNDNDNSLVLLLSYGEVSFLFVGDIESYGEVALYDIDLPVGPLVLKIAHHGSATSTSLAFLDWVQPDLAVMSTGSEDPPASATLSIKGIPYCMTSDAGTIRISTDGTSLEFDQAILHIAQPEPEAAAEAPSTSAIAADTLVITEVEMNPPGSDSGAEWIEIHNPTEQAITLAGWAASYTGYSGGWDPIPFVTIQPGGYYRFVYPKQHLENSRGEVIQLRNRDYEIVDASPPGLRDSSNDLRTWQRVPDGPDLDSDDDWVFRNGTPGCEN